MPKINLNQHEILSVLAAVVTVVVSVVPSWSPDKQAVLAAGGLLVSGIFAVIGVAKRLADSHVSLALVIADLKSTVEKMLEQLVSQQSKPAVRRPAKHRLADALPAVDPAAAPVDPVSPAPAAPAA
jgi:hypothetical protein